MSNTWYSIFGTALLLAATACGGKFVIVKSRFVEATREGDRDVTPSPKYSELIEAGAIKKVAVRAPDACAAADASQRTGAARGEQTVMSTRCGVEMGEIERALTSAGFVVISWRDLDQTITKDGLTPLDAAKQLGADVLFQINSLEQVVSRPGKDARWDRVFCKSNKKGEIQEPAQLEEVDMNDLAGRVGEQERLAADAVTSQAAMLDVNAVLVEGGQTIWFYRWIKPELSEREDALAVHFKFDKRGWLPLGVFNPYAAETPADPKSGNAQSTSVSTGSAANDERQARYFELVREVVKDFAEAFASGETGDVKQAFAPPAGQGDAKAPPSGGNGAGGSLACEGTVALKRVSGAPTK